MSFRFKLVSCLAVLGILALCGCGGTTYQHGDFRLVVAETSEKKLDALMPTIDREVIAAIREIEKEHDFSSGSWGFWGGTVSKYVTYHGKDDAAPGCLTITYRPEARAISIGPWQTESAGVLAIRAAILKKLYDRLPDVRVEYTQRKDSEVTFGG
jgi:hypothetical protein